MGKSGVVPLTHAIHYVQEMQSFMCGTMLGRLIFNSATAQGEETLNLSK